MLSRCLPALVFIGSLLATGCDEEPEPPSQQAVEEAWRRADHATQQSVAAQADVKHLARLRDIDRLRYHSDVADLSTQTSTLRGLAITLFLALLAALIWLAVEIRRRRILSAIIPLAQPAENDRPPVESPDSVAKSLIS
jgi:hypothetical protein